MLHRTKTDNIYYRSLDTHQYLPTVHGTYSTRKFPQTVSVILGINSHPAGSAQTHSHNAILQRIQKLAV